MEKSVPATIDEKTAFLKESRIAVWDVIASCDIHGSSDSSIRNVEPNDLNIILETAKIRHIFANGATAHKLYEKYCRPVTGRLCTKLPSTSPANAAFTMEKLLEYWKIIREV